MLKPVGKDQRSGTEAEKEAALKADLAEMKANPHKYGGAYSGAIPAQQTVLSGINLINEKGEPVRVVPAKGVAKEEK